MNCSLWHIGALLMYIFLIATQSFLLPDGICICILRKTQLGFQHKIHMHSLGVPLGYRRRAPLADSLKLNLN
jgi:hypothetical protein